MNTTTNLGLKKPQKAAGDPIDIDVLNDNSDIIDNFAGITAAKLTADEAKLDELYNGDLTTSAANLISYLDTSLIDTANSAFEIRRYGEMCFARVSLKTITSALTGSDIINTTAIPSTLRPETSIYPPLVARNSAAWGPATLAQAAISIETNGNVTLRTGAEKANATYVVGYFSYYAGAAPARMAAAAPDDPETGEAGEEGKEER